VRYEDSIMRYKDADMKNKVPVVRLLFYFIFYYKYCLTTFSMSWQVTFIYIALYKIKQLHTNKQENKC